MSTDHSHGGFGPTFHDKGKIQTIHYGAIEDLERTLNLHGERDAAFLVKPVLRESPLSTLPAHLSDDLVSIVVPPSGYLARVPARNTMCCSSATRSRQWGFSPLCIAVSHVMPL
ncbi:hypothetical protein SCLCIDRAFT_33960 [Scleroderma citrinum Foug A]|uniref:Uncharacterized protein n=1 Tax=Scleroderma citrinum Foug A TaxID=1036808 RepID=A0A0C3CQE9_9AGAM|nr:hypothetical protein SCLCIDRAFT_33960 [Scleroderma citrinum Foug A]